jgi:large subunit ribosomal protein L25
MSRSNLSVTKRTETGNGPNRRLRAAGTVPAVVYSKGKPPVAVAADPKAVVAHLKGPLGKNGAIDLAVEGETTPRLAIIQEYTVHPWKRSLEHVDFWEITPDTVLTVTVPFSGVGKSEAEKVGGRVRFTRDDITIKAKAADMPAKVTFDMAALTPGDHNITISKIPMPPGVTAHFKHDFSLIQVFMAKVAAEAEEAKPAGKDAKKPAAKAPAKAAAAPAKKK